MSKKKKRQAVSSAGRAPGSVPGERGGGVGNSDCWPLFESYNGLSAPGRAAALERLGIRVADRAVLGILTKSHFVIPGKTRFACRRCGECCRYARKIAQLTYEPCLFLSAGNSCGKHDERYLVCKWFPFWVYHDAARGPLLTIKPYCSGYGTGPLVEYGGTLARMRELEAEEARESDGAFVIHEVLFIPGRKEWTFPSRANIDELMSHIRKEGSRAAVERPVERCDEVHYAHHYTSGLLGSIQSPLVTVNERGLVTDANEAAVALARRDRTCFVGRDFSSCFVNPERIVSFINTCLARGRETASPQRLRFPDESASPVLLNGLAYRDRSDGLVHGVLVCVNQVSAAVYGEVGQSRSYARGLLEASLDALMVIDRDGAVTDVNEAVVSMTGRSREALVGSPFGNLFAERDKAALGMERAFTGGSIRACDLTLQGAGGARIPVSVNATVYRDGEGIVQGIFASARDIRERLAMMRELEEAKNYARELIESCIDLMVTIDREGAITDANRAALSLTGRSRNELVGAAFDGFFDEPERARSGVDLTFRNGEVRNYRMNLISASGRAIPVSFNATLYRDSLGAVRGVLAVARENA